MNPNQTGRSYENLIEASLRQYQLDGLAYGQRNYPEIIQRGYQATVVGRAGPDWTVFVKVLKGRAVQLEVKTWKGKDKKLMSWVGSKSKRRRRIQYEALVEAHRDGAALCFYLVAWRHLSFGVDWRLYRVGALVEPEPTDRGLLFKRKNGVPVPDKKGWPDWLSGIIKTHNKTLREEL